MRALLRRTLAAAFAAVLTMTTVLPAVTADPGMTEDAATAEELVVVNSDFEQSLNEDGSIPGWDIWGMQYPQTSYSLTDTAGAHSGQRSLQIDDTNTERGIGVESEPVAVTSGLTYRLSGMMNVTRDNASLSIRFYDRDGELVDSDVHILAVADGEWRQASVALKAPVGTQTATALLYSSTGDTGQAALDDVELHAVEDTEPPTDSGPPSPEEVEAMDPRVEHVGAPVTSSRTWNTLLAEEDGNRVVYSVFAGVGSSVSPAAFVVADAETGETIRSLPIPGASGTVEIEQATDGRVYFGTSSDFTLWRYDPVAFEVEEIGPLDHRDPSAAQIWSLAAAEDGTMYVGTYPEGTLYRYDPADGGHIDDLGVVDSTQPYIRALEYDTERRQLYAGVGGRSAQVYQIDVATGEQRAMLTPENAPGAQEEQFISSFSFDGERLFARSGSNRLLVVTAAGDVEYWSQNDRERFGYLVEPRPDESGTYILALNTYREYDPATGLITDLGIPIDGVLSDAVWVQSDDPEWPGWTMIASTVSGVQTVNFETGKTEFVEITYNNPAVVQKILTGPDSLYASGYTEGLTRFDSVTGEIGETYQGGQYESSVVRDGKMLLGAYGNAQVLEYDPATGDPPRLLFSLESAGQDRPFGMAYDEAGDRLFVGTVAKYGSTQGALSQYDFATGELQTFTEEIVTDQSVISVLYHEGLVYLGTSIDGGLAAPDSEQTSGHFVVFDPDTGEVVRDIVPVEGNEGVTGLLTGPDGLIWGVSEDTVFTFDPQSEEITFSEPLLGDRYGTNTVWAFAYLVIGADGAVYGTNRYQFFRIDPATMEYTQILDGVGNYANVDANGDIVFANGINVYRYQVSRGTDPSPCTDTVTAASGGGLLVESGKTVCVEAARIDGTVEVSEGGSLIATGAELRGGVQAEGAARIEVRDSDIRGTVRIDDSTGPVIVSGSRIKGELNCTGNASDPGDDGAANEVTGPRTEQCAGL